MQSRYATLISLANILRRVTPVKKTTTFLLHVKPASITTMDSGTDTEAKHNIILLTISQIKLITTEIFKYPES